MRHGPVVRRLLVDSGHKDSTSDDSSGKTTKKKAHKSHKDLTSDDLSNKTAKKRAYESHKTLRKTKFWKLFEVGVYDKDFQGTITNFEDGRYHTVYDDGDREDFSENDATEARTISPDCNTTRCEG